LGFEEFLVLFKFLINPGLGLGLGAWGFFIQAPKIREENTIF